MSDKVECAEISIKGSLSGGSDFYFDCDIFKHYYNLRTKAFEIKVSPGNRLAKILWRYLWRDVKITFYQEEVKQ